MSTNVSYRNTALKGIKWQTTCQYEKHSSESQKTVIQQLITLIDLYSLY
jgi:hypothetical protein